ncbi:protein-(glutamine-N5) methyltransferase, release factor-specific, partial [Vibrio sp. 10N.222.55.E8]
AFEHGYDQGLAVREIMQTLGYVDIVTEKDYGGNDRVTLGRYDF